MTTHGDNRMDTSYNGSFGVRTFGMLYQESRDRAVGYDPPGSNFKDNGSFDLALGSPIPKALPGMHEGVVAVYDVTSAMYPSGIFGNYSNGNATYIGEDNLLNVSLPMTPVEWVRDITLGVVLAALSLLTFLGNAMVLHAVRTERRLQSVGCFPNTKNPHIH